jgi:ethanolamine utilization protein EutP (predicted NTPase)
MKTKDELELEYLSLKQKYGKVYELEVPLDEDDSTKVATLFLKKADRTVISIVSKLIDISTDKAIEAGLKNLYVGGDDLSLVLNNDDAFLSCEAGLVQIIRKQQAVLKKK